MFHSKDNRNRGRFRYYPSFTSAYVGLFGVFRFGLILAVNRLLQSEFYCQGCGLRTHADDMSAGVVLGRRKSVHFLKHFKCVRAQAPPNQPLGTHGLMDAFRV